MAASNLTVSACRSRQWAIRRVIFSPKRFPVVCLDFGAHITTRVSTCPCRRFSSKDALLQNPGTSEYSFPFLQAL